MLMIAFSHVFYFDSFISLDHQNSTTPYKINKYGNHNFHTAQRFN